VILAKTESSRLKHYLKQIGGALTIGLRLMVVD
jgi:hypothetical protein